MKKKQYPIEDAAEDFLRSAANLLNDGGYFYFRKKKTKMDYAFIVFWHIVLVLWSITMGRR
jgi:hypothetical protein